MVKTYRIGSNSEEDTIYAEVVRSHSYCRVIFGNGTVEYIPDYLVFASPLEGNYDEVAVRIAYSRLYGY
jgi:hypothetical protein